MDKNKETKNTKIVCLNELVSRFSVLSHSTLIAMTSFFAIFWSIIVTFNNSNLTPLIISCIAITLFSITLTMISIKYYKNENKVLNFLSKNQEEYVTTKEVHKILNEKISILSLFKKGKWYLIWIILMWVIHISCSIVFFVLL